MADSFPNAMAAVLMAGGRRQRGTRLRWSLPHAEVVHDVREIQGLGGTCSCVVRQFREYRMQWKTSMVARNISLVYIIDFESNVTQDSLAVSRNTFFAT